MSTKRDQIKSEAARMFHKRGYSATNLRELAAAVGIKAPSLYNHISSKQELLRELLLEMAGHFTKVMVDVIESSMSPVEKLERLIVEHVRLTVEHPDSIALITSEWVHLEGPQKEQYLLMRNEYEEQFRKILNDCMQAGHFEKINVDIALFSTLSTLRWLYSWYGKHRDISPDELERQLTHILIDGMRVK